MSKITFKNYFEMALQGKYRDEYNDLDDIDNKFEYQQQIAKEMQLELHKIDTDIEVEYTNSHGGRFEVFAKNVIDKVEIKNKKLAETIKQDIKKIISEYQTDESLPYINGHGDVVCDIWDKSVKSIYDN